MNRVFKTIVLLLVIQISYSTVLYAQEFSDYKIGEKLEGKDMVNMDIGGLPGTLFIYTHKNKVIRSMGFVPSRDGGINPSKVMKGDFIRFKSFMEQYYQSGFERTIDTAQKKQHYKLKYNGCNVVITIDEFDGDFSYSSLVFMINKI
ncbi:hypothetical protein [Flammeovirga sp. SJP92]|uniref:hypothetical protein n=1 Tax=Flammeovirga sp. SJP92 TaxID=1775430 RepID=UPI00078718A1|nr:hypothetical protein [Flammeovirga sp. SJP92]KXX71943.1 hypothetical protein AVL50_03930 [Flammeovirga sp. SJP92]